MVREDILGGLKLALARGESLQSAMQSFYNAGYYKEEIEEAARALHQQATNQLPQQPKAQTAKPASYAKPQISQPQVQQQNQEKFQLQKPAEEQVHPAQGDISPRRQTIHYQNPDEVIPPEEKESIINRFKQLKPTKDQSEKVSAYGEYKKPGIDAVTIILIIILVALLGILAAVFFYKEKLIEFLNGFLD